MMRSACCEVMPGSDAKSSFEALFRSTVFLLLSPSFTPWATALVSRLMAAVSSAVFCRIWSGLWFVQATLRPNERRTDANQTREIIVFRCHRIGVGCRRIRIAAHPRKPDGIYVGDSLRAQAEGGEIMRNILTALFSVALLCGAALAQQTPPPNPDTQTPRSDELPNQPAQQ